MCGAVVDKERSSRTVCPESLFQINPLSCTERKISMVLVCEMAALLKCKHYSSRQSRLTDPGDPDQCHDVYLSCDESREKGLFNNAADRQRGCDVRVTSRAPVIERAWGRLARQLVVHGHCGGSKLDRELELIG